MQTYEALKHSTWECKYHIVIIPKYRKKVLYGSRRDALHAEGEHPLAHSSNKGRDS